jgi:hypothetical protein
MLRVTVKTLDGQQSTLSAPDGGRTTVSVLKQLPEWQRLVKGIARQKQLIICNGRVLDDALSLEQQGVVAKGGAGTGTGREVCLRVVVQVAEGASSGGGGGSRGPVGRGGSSRAAATSTARLKYLESFVDSACTAEARSRTDGARRKVSAHRSRRAVWGGGGGA